jgi:amino acid transporter
MKPSTIKKLSFIVILISLAMMILSLITYKFNFPGPISENHSWWGEFGSFIGGISSPFAIIIGFCSVLITLIINSEQSVKKSGAKQFF